MIGSGDVMGSMLAEDDEEWSSTAVGCRRSYSSSSLITRVGEGTFDVPPCAFEGPPSDIGVLRFCSVSGGGGGSCD